MAAAVAVPWLWFVARDWHPLADAVAIMLPIIGVLAAVTSAVAGKALWRPFHSPPLRGTTGWLVAAAGTAASLSTVAVALVATLGPWTQQPMPPPVPGQVFVLAVSNVLESNPAEQEAIDRLLDADADVLVTAETTEAIDIALTGRYPATTGGQTPQADRDFDADGVGVYARVPFTVLADPDVPIADHRVVRVRLETAGGPVVLYGVHLPRPGLRTIADHTVDLLTYADIVAALEVAVAAEQLPVIVAGDLNLTDRARGYRSLTTGPDGGLRDAMRATPTGPTARKQYLRPLLLRIDHVLVSPSLCGESPSRFLVPGSDHTGLRVALGQCGDMETPS